MPDSGGAGDYDSGVVDSSSDAAGKNAEKSAYEMTGDDLLKVHFLDVGQADCIVAELPNGENMLVDAGNNDDSAAILGYLDKLGIDRLDYVIGTHPHEDHIGSL
ncbi:MAG: MBL fold metallo-hydrolase, partial [Clostridiales bacterium]|nr:MBL fold metallo-hydrolase [Clostridiales bacterium]